MYEANRGSTNAILHVAFKQRLITRPAFRKIICKTFLAAWRRTL